MSSSSFLSSLSSFYSSRVLPLTQLPSFRLFLAVSLSSLLTGISLLSFQSLQRQTQRRALRDSVESHFKNGQTSSSSSKKKQQRRNGRIGVKGRELHDSDQEDDYNSDDENDHEEDDVEEMQDYTQARNIKQAKAALETSKNSNANSKNDTPRLIDEEIINEALARNIAFLGEEAMQKIRNSFVIVVGMGGVGSAAATMLVRSGVGKIRLVDFDQVSLSSLNRHSVANLSDVGTSKVDCCARHFRSIAPWVSIEPINSLFSSSSALELLSDSPDWVIDCIDNISTKIDLLLYCKKNGLKVFSAMGAGGKLDPSRVQISDISNTFEDGLARAVRVGLKKGGVGGGVPVVYSTERPSTQGALLPLPEEEFQKGKVSELSALDAFRVRILPVLGPLPCMFGQAAAAYIIGMLAGNLEMNPLPVKNRYKVYTRMLQDLAGREQKLTGATRIPISESDVNYLLEDLHRGRSVVCPSNVIPARPTLIRWSPPSHPLTSTSFTDEGDDFEAVHVGNLVVMERKEADKHEKEVLQEGKSAKEVWGKETVDLVEKRRGLERESRDYRLL